ncbi:hypothetical protein F53441_10532 [Fusarium austroafricanum]|uniref:Uncharacterized protein n=1 Tax=Fusarium austroafricanum TaxID=2364996 RepID=A0A8H4KAJ9_9HYPO|nr:hypothetical protein F53441_10532 [Fusarium austroafricanum]
MLSKLFLPLLLLLGLLASSASAQCSCSNKGGRGHRHHARDVGKRLGLTNEPSHPLLHERFNQHLSPAEAYELPRPLRRPPVSGRSPESMPDELPENTHQAVKRESDNVVHPEFWGTSLGYKRSTQSMRDDLLRKIRDALTVGPRGGPDPDLLPKEDKKSGFKKVISRDEPQEEDIFSPQINSVKEQEMRRIADAIGMAVQQGQEVEAQHQAINHMNVTISQVSEDPIIVNVEIKNPSDLSINFWDEYSPISPSAFELGFFEIFADEVALNFGEKTRTRVSQDFKQSIENIDNVLHLGPGESLDRNITIPPESVKENGNWLEMLKAANKVKLQSAGKWIGIGACASNDTVANREAFAEWSDADHSWASNFIELDL